MNTMNGKDHLIEIQDLGREYMAGDTTVCAIKEMSFFIDDGEFVSIVGQSGAGQKHTPGGAGGAESTHPGQCMGGYTGLVWSDQ